ncbi:hypothetical protein PENTCL1PPCAC_840, partial [Pristionchus entomophagus]
LACAQVESTTPLIATDSLTHVEFVAAALIPTGQPEREVFHRPEYPKESDMAWAYETYDMGSAFTMSLPEGYNFNDWVVYNKSMLEGPAATISSLNLRLSVHFSDFSCCSSCCCSRDQCGRHARSEKEW